MIDLPISKIGNLELNVLQGPMGVGISGKSLASAVANCGGGGMIPAVGLSEARNAGGIEINQGNYIKENQKALRAEIREARALVSPGAKGFIGVNVMHALTDFEPLVQVASEEEVDLLTASAGFDPNLMSLVGKNTKVGIVISYGKFARKVCEIYEKAGRLPDLLIVEGPKAGGHLGYGRRKLDNPEFLESSLEREIQRTKEIAEKFGNIPVFAAGGISNGYHIREARRWGAEGVQIATAFIPTKECDASKEFKMLHLDANEEDVVIIDSPVGMPGRAINNDFLRKVAAGEKIPVKCLYKCLKKCNPKEAPYCIAKALIAAQRGDLENGFAFTGSNVHLSTRELYLDAKGEFVTVRDVFERFSREYREAA